MGPLAAHPYDIRDAMGRSEHPSPSDIRGRAGSHLLPHGVPPFGGEPYVDAARPLAFRSSMARSVMPEFVSTHSNGASELPPSLLLGVNASIAEHRNAP